MGWVGSVTEVEVPYITWKKWEGGTNKTKRTSFFLSTVQYFFYHCLPFWFIECAVVQLNLNLCIISVHCMCLVCDFSHQEEGTRGVQQLGRAHRWWPRHSSPNPSRECTPIQVQGLPWGAKHRLWVPRNAGGDPEGVPWHVPQLLPRLLSHRAAEVVVPLRPSTADGAGKPGLSRFLPCPSSCLLWSTTDAKIKIPSA